MYRAPTELGIPPPAPLNKMLHMAEADEAFVNGDGGTTPPPATPAYYAYPKGSQGPLAAWAQRVFLVQTQPPRGGASAALLSRARMPSLPSSAPSLANGPAASAYVILERERTVVSVGMHRGADAGVHELGTAQ